MEVTWIILGMVIIYFLNRAYRSFMLNMRLKRGIKSELNDILNDPRYKVKGKNE